MKKSVVPERAEKPGTMKHEQGRSHSKTIHAGGLEESLISITNLVKGKGE